MGRRRWPEPGEDVVQQAAAFCNYYQVRLSGEARALLDAGLSPRGYFERLRAAGCLAEARRVLSHVLPRRRALWWSGLCVWESCRPESGMLADALRAVVAYCVEPSEANRRAAETVGKAARRDGLARSLALGAFLSDGSISRPQLRFVPPRPFAAGRLVSVAVYLAAVRRDPSGYRDHLSRYLDIGLELAEGPDPWQQAEAETFPHAVATWDALAARPAEAEVVGDYLAGWTGA